jgi:hypothetical protein
MSEVKAMNYGQAQAVKVLAAARMGIEVGDEETAKAMLSGAPVHAMFGARLEGEACRVHELIRTSEERVREANEHVAAITREYGFVIEGHS